MTKRECYSLFLVTSITHTVINLYRGYDVLELITRTSVQSLLTYLLVGILVVAIRR